MLSKHAFKIWRKKGNDFLIIVPLKPFALATKELCQCCTGYHVLCIYHISTYGGTNNELISEYQCLIMFVGNHRVNIMIKFVLLWSLINVKHSSRDKRWTVIILVSIWFLTIVNSYRDNVLFLDDIWLATWDIRPTGVQTSAVSEHAHENGLYPIWSEVKFIDQDPHWYTSRVKEVIHIRLHPNNINRDSGIEIPEAWMSSIKKHNNRKTVQQRTAKGTATLRNYGTIEGWNAPITADCRDINGAV